MAKSKLDQMVEVYAEHKQMFNSATVTPKEKAFMIARLKELALDDALKDIKNEQIQQMKQEAKKEAKSYKKSLFKKVRTTLIIETIFVALLVGIMVNQFTILLPSNSSGLIIIVCLLLCILLIWLETGKN